MVKRVVADEASRFLIRYYHQDEELIGNQVVDYCQVKSAPGFLADTHDKASFDAILDTVGSQELFKKSPMYLKSDGILVNVGEGSGETGQLNFILQALRNTHQPSFLGGVPRKYVTFSAPLTGSNAERLASLAKEGKMRISMPPCCVKSDC